MDLMIQSAIRKLPSLKEIIITNVQTNDEYVYEREENGIIIKEIGYGLRRKHKNLINYYVSREVMKLPDVLEAKDVEKMVEKSINDVLHPFGHALGLHECLVHVSKEYVLFCDPDVIFLSNADETYFNLMEKHDLHYVGCMHESADKVAYGYFPYLANSLVLKDNLPQGNFLHDELYFHESIRYEPGQLIDRAISANGKWLIRGVVPNHTDKFALGDKEMHVDFDTGSNLYLWALSQRWKWLSFLTADCQYYRTSFYRSNCNVKDKFKPEKLIYHQFGRFRNFDEFKRVYQENNEE